MNQKNLRKNKRKKCLVPVEGKKGTVYENIQTTDICRDGIGFISDRKIFIDEKIAVEMEYMRNGISFLKVGKVRWVEKVPGSDCYRFGMKLNKQYNKTSRYKKDLETPPATGKGKK